MKTLEKLSFPDQIFTDYHDRSGRAHFISRNFAPYLTWAKSILDIGCDDNRLKDKWGTKVTGIDIGGAPDIHVNLERELLSRFADESFDLLICTDVLEHLDNLHAVFDDIVRVANGNIIISLPNCAHIGRVLPILLGKSSGKYYGLPPEAPIDRHKWYFSWKEIQAFFRQNASRSKMSIDLELLTYSYPNPIVRGLLQAASIVMPVTMFAQGYWVVLSKHADKRSRN